MLSPVKIWRNQQKIKELLNLCGKIVSFTRVYTPPSGFEAQAPYVVVVVRLENGIRYTSQLVDWEKKHLVVGQKVIAVLRRTKEAGEEGVIAYGVKFKPV